MTYAGLIGIGVFVVVLLIVNIKNLLVGCNKISNPLYDTEEKRNYLKRKSIIGLILILIGIIIVISAFV